MMTADSVPENNGPTATKGKNFVSLSIPKESFKDGHYYFDYSALIDPTPKGSVSLKKLVAAEDYDLDDPFIDDEDESEFNGADPLARREFYIWKGKLQAPESAMTIEKSIHKKKIAVKSSSKKTKRIDDAAKKEGSKNKKKRKIDSDELKENQAALESSSLSSQIAEPSGREKVDEKMAEQSESKREGDKKGSKFAGLPKPKLEIFKPFLKLKLDLAMEAFRQEAEETEIQDPKKFPSNLRKACSTALVCQLHYQEDKNRIDDKWLESIYGFLSFPAASLKKLIESRLLVVTLDDYLRILLPKLYAKLKEEVSKDPKFPAVVKDLINDILEAEFDVNIIRHIIECLTGKTCTLPSELAVRKTVYKKIAACWQEKDVPPSTSDIGKNANKWKRKLVLAKLEEHKIQPELIQPATDENEEKPKKALNGDCTANILKLHLNPIDISPNLNESPRSSPSTPHDVKKNGDDAAMMQSDDIINDCMDPATESNAAPQRENAAEPITKDRSEAVSINVLDSAIYNGTVKSTSSEMEKSVSQTVAHPPTALSPTPAPDVETEQEANEEEIIVTVVDERLEK